MGGIKTFVQDRDIFEIKKFEKKLKVYLVKIFKGPGEYFKIERFSRWCVFETERVHCKLHKLLPFHKDFLNKVNYFNESLCRYNRGMHNSCKKLKTRH